MSKLLDERPLFVLPSLAMKHGLNEAIVLQQLHWTLGSDRALVVDGRRWIKAGLEFWREQFPFWSESTIRRAFAALKETNVIEVSRGREANTYTINYDILEAGTVQDERSGAVNLNGVTGQDDASTVQVERSPCKRAVESSSEREDGGGQAATDSVHLPGLAPPPPPKQAATSEPLVDELWGHYVASFGDALRVKELTDPRRRDLRKALKAVAEDVEICKRAVDGLKEYRRHKPGKTSLDVIFSTGPQDRSNLTEKIEWWAQQAPDKEKAEIPASVPTHQRGRVLELIASVLKPERMKLTDSQIERCDESAVILRRQFGLKVRSDGKGNWQGLEEVPKEEE